MTNGEWLRKLSDAELAEFLCYLRYGHDGSCYGCIMESMCKIGCNGMSAWVGLEHEDD